MRTHYDDYISKRFNVTFMLNFKMSIIDILESGPESNDPKERNKEDSTGPGPEGELRLGHGPSAEPKSAPSGLGWARPPRSKH